MAIKEELAKIDPRIKKKLLSSMNDPKIKESLAKSVQLFPKFGENLDIIEDHIILVQKNQVEFQNYLEEIIANQQKILEKLGDMNEKKI